MGGDRVGIGSLLGSCRRFCSPLLDRRTSSPPVLFNLRRLSGLAAGLVIGIVGDAAVRAVAMQPRVYVGMVLILIFAEALGLYGLIVALILTSNVSNDCLT